GDHLSHTGDRADNGLTVSLVRPPQWRQERNPFMPRFSPASFRVVTRQFRFPRGIRTGTYAAWLPPLAVFTAACGLAAFLFVRFSVESRNLWSDAIHDRNAHFATGLSWAEDVKHGRLLQFISDFDKARTWPPLHDGALVGITCLFSGGDPRC